MFLIDNHRDNHRDNRPGRMNDVILISGLIIWFVFIGIQAVGGLTLLKEYYQDTLEYLQRMPVLMYATAFIPLLILIVLLIGKSN